MKKIGFYAGSFDPFTVGHLRIVLEALCKYDEVIIGVGENASKSDCLFEAEERIELIEQSIYDFVNWYAGRFLSDIQPSETEKIAFERLQNERDCISFLAYQSSTVDVALACGATALIRGKRIGCDDEDEMRLASINQRLLAIRKAHLSMDLIPLPKEDLTFVSSSAFKGLCEIYEYIAAMDFVAPKNTFAEKLISDIDLAILADKKNYFGYCVQLVRENSAIKAETFCKRRCEFLQSMLEKDKIFLTPFFGEKFEEAAKRNMQKELLKLSGTL